MRQVGLSIDGPAAYLWGVMPPHGTNHAAGVILCATRVPSTQTLVWRVARLEMLRPMPRTVKLVERPPWWSRRHSDSMSHCVAAIVALVAVSACSIAQRGTAPTLPTADQELNLVIAMFAYAKTAFPSSWAGVPAEIYCVDPALSDRLRTLSTDFERSVRPSSDCRLDLRPGRPAAEQRVRHIPSGRTAVIYTFSAPTPTSRDEATIDLTWFGAHHFAAGYRCTLRREQSLWSVVECDQTRDYRSIG